ncbi:DMT family transporter [Galbitalea sp. SE-J8]|uniref:EamA family transporter n=1 Tax=Galbitalea sp. SE-J8 TaxID=3054952 RepID=UPI00259CC61B|nr:DMT family transporter [Galbitalea sp. SE-J8]MDM4763824.1 DMT family transporter [Galbitalea sp. SE-J8]
MTRKPTARGLLVALVASATFGLSGAFAKPLLEAGWSPAAAVTVRALLGAVVLLPVVLLSLRGRWGALWRARRRVLVMAFIGVAGCQLAYFASVQRIAVGTAILIEYLAPLALVVWVWARSRRMPQRVVLIGSAVAVAGLVLVLGPGVLGRIDALGLVFALIAMIGCAVYYVVAAEDDGDLPPVALAGSGLLLGGTVLGVVGLTGLVPFTFTTAPVAMFGTVLPIWVPVLVLGVVSSAIAYATSIVATQLLGSRLASFVGLLEVVAATLYAWLLLGEQLTIPQLIGGALILAGIALVRSEKPADAAVEPGGRARPVPALID